MNLPDTAELLNLRDARNTHCTAQQIEAARTRLREAIRERNGRDPVEVAAELLGNVHGMTERYLLYGAAYDIREEGAADRGSVPTQDRPAGDPGKKGKGRGKGKGKATHKARPSRSWVKAIGKDAVVRTWPTETELTEADWIAAFAAHAHRGFCVREPAWGFCRIAAVLSTELDAGSVRLADGVLVVGLRVDEKKGLPTARLRAEALKVVKERIAAAGTGAVHQEDVDAAYDELASRWYAGATPTTTVYPVTVELAERRVAIHATNLKARDHFVKVLRAAFPAVEWALVGLSDGKLAARACNWTSTDLRKEDGVGQSRCSLIADYLLWLLAKCLAGTAVVTVGEAGRWEYWLDDKIELLRDTGEDKRLVVKLGKAVTEGGGLTAALADGALPTSLRIGFRAPTESKFYATINKHGLSAAGLPALCTAGDTVDAAMVERLGLRRLLEEAHEALLRQFESERVSGWSQRVQAIRRAVGLDLVERYAWDETTKQGFLFADMLPGRQEALPGVVEVAVGGGKGRGRRSRAVGEA